MTTTTLSTSTVIAVSEPVFTGPERLALAGFLAGYTGLNREAYSLDLRQFTAWCQQRDIRLFQARRPDIEASPATWKPRGRARATVTRRLRLPGWRPRHTEHPAQPSLAWPARPA